MSYNTKYILKYCNRFNDALRIELQLKDYVGEAFLIVNDDDYVVNENGDYVVMNIDGTYNPDRDKLPIEGATNPFSLTYRNDLGEKGGTIRATEANMSFFENLSFNIDDLASNDETGIRCVFYINDEIEWIGFVTPDFFNVEITENPIIDLTASDRLGILKDVDYPIDYSNMLTRKSDLVIINKILNETGLELKVNVLCDFECEQVTNSLGSILNDVYVSEMRFVSTDNKVTSCYDVLKSILDKYNCLITQYKGEWWVVNKEQLENGYGTIFTYSSSLAYLSSSQFNQEEVNFNLIDTGGQRTIIPAGGKNTYNLGVDSYASYPINGNMERYTVVFNEPPTWNHWTKRLIGLNANLTTLLPISYDGSGEVIESYDDVKNNLMIGVGSDGPTDNEWLYQSDWFDLPTLDSRKMSFDVSINAVGKPNTRLRVMIIIQFPNQSNHKYAWLNYDNGNYVFNFQKYINDPGPYNTIDSNTANLNDLNLVFEDKYGNVLTSVDKEFKFTVNASNGQNQNYDLTRSKMMVRIYPNSVTSGNVSNLPNLKNYIKSISIDFKTDNQDPKGVIFQSVLDGKYTKSTEVKNVMHGDLQTVGQNGFFYNYRNDSLSIQYNNDGDKLKRWKSTIDTSWQPLLIHSLRQLTKSYGKAHDELSIGFELARINPLSILAIKCFSYRYIEMQEGLLQNGQDDYIQAFIGKYLNNKKYILIEGTVDYLRSQFSGKLAQVLTSGVNSQEYIYSDFG